MEQVLQELKENNPFPFLKEWEWDDDWPLDAFFVYIGLMVWLLAPIWVPIRLWQQYRCRVLGHVPATYTPSSLAQHWHVDPYDYCSRCHRKL